MLTRARTFLLLSALTTLALQSSCGDSSFEEGKVSLSEETPSAETTASFNTQSVSAMHCTDKVPQDDSPQTYCKTLADGSVHSVTLKPSTYVQDPETCVITVVDDGVKITLLEMDFELCAQ